MTQTAHTPKASYEGNLTLVDGSGFIFRAYHALPPFTAPDGTPIGAVFGFCTMLLKFLNQHPEDQRMLVVFDAGRGNFRHDIYAAYKAHRPEAPDDLKVQFPIFREVCDAFGLPFIEMPGFEADDIIATYAREAENAHWHTTIISGDKDLMQLVGPNTQLLDPMKNKVIGVNEVMEKFGVTPDKVIDVQALMGDSSDNIPGVPGIGPKTAAELIQRFHTLEGVFDNVQSITQTKRRQTLIDHKEQALISKRLVTLDQHVVMPQSITKIAPYVMPTQSVQKFCERFQFKNLLNRVSAKGEGSKTASMERMGAAFEKDGANDKSAHETLAHAYTNVKTSYKTITDEAALQQWLEGVKHTLTLDCETTSLHIRDAELVGLALARAPGEACYIPLTHTNDLMSQNTQLSFESVFQMLAPILQNPAIIKIGHNLKYDLNILRPHVSVIAPMEDTLVMSYALDGGLHRHNLDALIKHYFDHTMIAYKDVVGIGKKQKNFRNVPITEASPYAAEDADFTHRLYLLLKERLFKENMTALYTHIERPMVHILKDMEYEGVLIDQAHLRILGEDFKTRASTLEAKIFDLAGCTFNVASPKQLGDVLFDQLKLPAPKRTKTGAYTTDNDVLESLAEKGIPIASLIVEWRSLMKLNATYVEGLLNAVHPFTKRVHTSYHMAGTTTGRLSSSDPNMQNIPIRTDDGRRIREAFMARPTFQLVSFDYSQVELRLLAHMADISSLKQAFCDGVDIHALTASQIFQTPLDAMTSELRRSAKAINFGIVYGISAYGLGQQLKISTPEAQNIIKAYFQQYPGIQQYMEDMKEYARNHGYVTTLMGRKCYTPGILDKRHPIRSFAERQAINAPLQGSNADIIKCAMRDLYEDIQNSENASCVKMLMQVHDELVFEIQDTKIEEWTKRIQNIMEHAASLSVPLLVDARANARWQ